MSFREFLQASVEPMWVFDPADLSFVCVNEAACRKLGYSHEAFRAMTMLDIRPRGDLGQYLDALRREARTKTPKPALWRHVSQSGQIQHVQEQNTWIRLDDRVLVATVVREANERWRAEADVASLLNGARCLLWQAEVWPLADGTLEWDLEFRNSDAARRHFPIEIRADESYSVAFDRAKLPEDRLKLRLAHVSELDSGLDSYRQEFRIRLISGEIRCISEVVNIERCAAARWKLTGVCTDVTALKGVQEEIQHVVESARCLLWQATVTDVNGELEWNLCFRNPEAAQQFLPVEIPEGKGYTEGFFAARPADHSEPINTLSANAIREGWRGYQQEFSVRTLDGTLHWMLEDVSIEPLGIGIWRLIGVCTDISERKRAEDVMRRSKLDLEERVSERTRALSEANLALYQEMQERVEAQQQAERANKAKSEFVSRMSHELRTPLNAILGFGQILQGQSLTARQQESVGHILKGGRHLLDLINEILDLARVEAGRAQLLLEPVSVGMVLEECCELLQTMATDRAIALLRARQDASCMVLADRQRLKQVLINLLGNGIKYNRPGGTVEASCTTKDRRVAISVTDTGVGVREEDRPRLFKPFERLEAASDVEGTGLGLSLAHRFVTLMGGAIDVQSEAGVGSTFTVELPSADAPEAHRAESPSPPSCLDAQAAHAHILLIEDRPENLRLIEMALADREGLHVHAAMRGGEGLDLAFELRPDLILLDLNLPDLSGRAVLQRLRADDRTRHIPVVVVSADASPVEIASLLGSGASAYLTKPFDLTELHRAIDGYLSK